MRLPIAGLSALTFAVSSVAYADAPMVATDIGPVQSLVAQVMGDLGAPKAIVPPGASPHGYSMRPSEARALSSAEVVFWMGAELSPALAQSIDTLAAKAEIHTLLDVPGTVLLEFREGATFAPHDHGDAHDHDDEHGHDGEHDHAEDHAEDHKDEHDHKGDHAHDEDHADTPVDPEPHAGESHDEDEHHDHAEGARPHGPHDHSDHAHDPHAWLDPQNGRVWLNHIAQVLSQHDPDNAAAYTANATRAILELEQLQAEIEQQLRPLDGLKFVVFHDAYQYFEQRFSLFASGAISLSDASDPGAARIAELRQAVADLGVSCVAAEPQFNPKLIAAVSEGSEVKTTVLDPIGMGLEPGADLYPNLLRGLAQGLIACR